MTFRTEMVQPLGRLEETEGWLMQPISWTGITSAFSKLEQIALLAMLSLSAFVSCRQQKPLIL
jgi:hypothetical protein